MGERRLIATTLPGPGEVTPRPPPRPSMPGSPQRHDATWLLNAAALAAGRPRSRPSCGPGPSLGRLAAAQAGALAVLRRDTPQRSPQRGQDIGRYGPVAMCGLVADLEPERRAA